MHVWIYADGGGSIGYGHLVRTGALTAECIDRGHEVTYLTSTPEVTRSTVPDAAGVVATDRPADVVDALTTRDADALVTDSYKVDHDLQRRFSDVVSRFSVISDWNQHHVHCDVLINGNLYAESLDYVWTGSEPTWCLGPDYLLLRRDVRRFIGREPPCREPPERALVMMGGSDGENVSPAALRAFDGTGLTVEVIVGPGFSNRSEIEAVAVETDCDVSLLDDPADLPERMFRADLAVSALGTTVYELLATGTPFVGVRTADNQALIADSLRERELVPIADGTCSDVDRALRELLDPAELRHFHDAGRRLLNPNSVDNVVDQILI